MKKLHTTKKQARKEIFVHSRRVCPRLRLQQQKIYNLPDIMLTAIRPKRISYRKQAHFFVGVGQETKEAWR